MAIRTSEEIMSRLQTIIGDDTSDETLSFIEDVRDTIGNNDNAERIRQLEEEVANTDKTWREKYRNAFFHGPDEDESQYRDESKPKTFDDLFKKG